MWDKTIPKDKIRAIGWRYYYVLSLLRKAFPDVYIARIGPIHKYIDGEEYPSVFVCQRLYEMGINVNFLFNPDEKIFNDTPIGKFVKAKFRGKKLKRLTEVLLERRRQEELRMNKMSEDEKSEIV